jgi:hypothetical protein
MENPTPNQHYIDRLYKSSAATQASLKTKATENGRYWAQHIAQAFHLERLTDWYNYETFRGQPLAPYCWLNLVFLAISDEGEEPDPKAWEFFRIPYQYIDNPAYVENFVLGTIDYWVSVRDQVYQIS